MRNRGSKVLCPNHRGHWSANVLRDEPIGDEGTWNCKVASDISKVVKVANFTCDGDSKGFNGVQSSQKHNVGHLKVVTCDTWATLFGVNYIRHLSQRHVDRPYQIKY